MYCSLLTRPYAHGTRHARRASQTCFVVFSLLCLFALLNGPQAAAQSTIIQSDFEDGTTQGWFGFGSPTLTNITGIAHGGTHSLQVTNRTANYMGPASDVTALLTPGSTYHISAWVRSTDANAAAGDLATMTIKRTDASCSGGTCYDTVGAYQAALTNTWLQLSGDYTVSSTATALTLYFQLANNDDFYLDDVVITSNTPPPPPTGCAAQDNSGFNINYEDGNVDGWSSRSGSSTVANAMDQSHSPMHSLLTTGRTANWDGPQIGIDNKMCAGSNYAISVWIMLQPTDGSSHIINMSLQTTYGSNTSYPTTTGYPGVTVVADGQWHQIKVPNYSMASVYDAGKASLYLQTNPSSGTDLVSFYIDDFKLTYLPPLQIEPSIASVYQHYADYFPIGTAVSTTDLSGAHSQLLVKHFNSITSGNDMKWDATEPTENTFSYGNADAEVAFAKANYIAVRGHTLLWHNQIPAWLFQKNDGSGAALDPANAADVALLKSRLQNHIQHVVTHFGTDVYAWDVVNEVIDESQPDCLRRSPWYNIIGPSYIDLAFQYARAASASAELFINDYNTTTDPKKTCLYNLVQGMISRGVPVDGVGHQMHSNLWYPPVQSLTDTVNLFHGLTTVAGKPLDQQVTEMDISIYPYPAVNVYDDYSLIPVDLLVQQGYLYRDFFEALKQLNSAPNNKKISDVTFWGMSDDETWLTTSSKVDAPLLFDNILQHKYAYTGIMSPLDLPGADIQTTISAATATVLSGSTVTYTITVLNNGHDDAATVGMVSGTPSSTVFQSLTAPANWTCTAPAVGASGQVSCTAASLANGASAQFVLTVTVPCVTSNGITIANSATASSITRDPNPAPNNAASVNVVVSNPPPVISGLAVNHPLLFPWFGHHFVKETLSYAISDNCDANLKGVVTVASNQQEKQRRHRPDIDWIILDPFHVALEAENEPFSRDGRIYTITVTATDSAGSSSSSSVDVVVRWPWHW